MIIVLLAYLKKLAVENGWQQPANTASRSLDDISDDQLFNWLNRERPLQTENEDLFDFSGFTSRIIERLSAGRNTIIEAKRLATEGENP